MQHTRRGRIMIYKSSDNGWARLEKQVDRHEPKDSKSTWRRVWKKPIPKKRPTGKQPPKSSRSSSTIIRRTCGSKKNLGVQSRSPKYLAHH